MMKNSIVAWLNRLLGKTEVYATKPKTGQLTVTHLVSATVFRAPVYEMEDKHRGKYFMSKNVFVLGVIRKTDFAAPSAASKADAVEMVRAKVGMRPEWGEIVSEEKPLTNSFMVRRGDVVEYMEALC